MALALFMVIAAAYGGLLLVNRSQAETRSQIIQEVGTKQEDLRPRVLDEIFQFDERIQRIRTAIVRHPLPSNLFSFVEQITHPQARFMNLNFSGDTNRLTMAGEAKSYAVLARQIAFLEGSPEIRHLEFGGLSRSKDGSVKFNLTIAFTPSFITKHP